MSQQPVSQEDLKKIKAEIEAARGNPATIEVKPAPAEKDAEETAKAPSQELIDALVGEDRWRPRLDSAERKKKIEDSLEPLSLESLLIKGTVTQEVPLIGDKLKAVFRHPSSAEDLHIKKLLTPQVSNATQIYAQDYFSVLNVVIGLDSYNGKQLPRTITIDDHGYVTVDSQAILDRMQFLLSLPKIVVSDLSVQLSWFEERVYSSYLEVMGDGTGETLKNG